MKNTIKKYQHNKFVVDSLFKRTMPKGPVEAFQANLVSDLTELEAKDLCCDLMVCIDKLSGVRDRIGDILEEYNFPA